MTQSFTRRADALARDSYYEATATRPVADDPMLDAAIDVDVCVIGAGFAGLSTALDCRARGLSVAVIDAQRPGWGASGRNGGQAITGFAKDEVIEQQLGADGARAAWSLSLDGVALIAERIARYGIDCDFTRGYLTVATKPRRIDDLRAWMNAATSRWGHPSLAWLDTGEIHARIASTRYLAGVHDPLSGHLHPLKYCLGLADAARREGVALYAHTPALDVVGGARPVVRTPSGEVRCRFVVSCCNAGPGGVLPAATAARIAPIASYIIATEPLGRARAGFRRDRSELLLRPGLQRPRRRAHRHRRTRGRRRDRGRHARVRPVRPPASPALSRRRCMATTRARTRDAVPPRTRAVLSPFTPLS